VGVAPASLVAKIGCITNNTAFKVVGVGMGAMGSAAEMGQFAQAVSNGDGYGAVEHGMKALMGLLDTAAAFGQACFAAGTPILTLDGSAAIEDLRRGDLVLARSELDPNGPLVPCRVVQLFQSRAELVTLRVGGREVRTTAEHPFWVEGRGWVSALKIQPGDRLLGADGRWTTVEAAATTGVLETVYNVEVEDYHTYFVGEAVWGFSVWAHNKTCEQHARILRNNLKAHGTTFTADEQAAHLVPTGAWSRRNATTRGKIEYAQRMLNELGIGVDHAANGFPTNMPGHLGTHKNAFFDYLYEELKLLETVKPRHKRGAVLEKLRSIASDLVDKAIVF